MEEKEYSETREERLLLTRTDLQATVRVLEGLMLSNVHEFAGKHYPTVAPDRLKLCICDVVIKSFYVKKAGVKQYFLDNDTTDPTPVLRNDSLTICNYSGSKIRVTFYDDKDFGSSQNAAEEFVLKQLGDGTPYVEIEAKGCVTIEVSDTKEGNEKAGIWINIEEEIPEGWRSAKGGGNGPDMEFDNP